MKRILRVGMIGGGADSLIGEVHRMAIRLTGRMELVCGAFGNTRQKSAESGEAIGLPSNRVYGAYRDLLRKEAQQDDDTRPDFIAIVTPNNMHYPSTMAALDAGFHVFCEAPMTTCMDEALNLKRKLIDKKLEFALAFTYSAYPMVQQARSLVAQGAVGNIRKVIVNYPQEWLTTRLETAGNKQALWRTDPRRAGPGGSLVDIGTHCAHLAAYVSGLAIKEVLADARAFIAGRPVDDDCTALLHFTNGAHGMIWSSQICIGQTNGLQIAVYGDKGSLAWRLADPNKLTLHSLTDPTRVYELGGPGMVETEKIPPPFPRGQAESYLSALASIYSAFADRVLNPPKKETPPTDYPSVDDGIAAMAFVDAVSRNLKNDPTAKWTPLPSTEI